VPDAAHDNLTRAEVATALRCTPRWVHKLLMDGVFPNASNPGGKRWIIPRADLDAYIEAGKPGAKESAAAQSMDTNTEGSA
jgi:excisionase family DNA binding protein